MLYIGKGQTFALPFLAMLPLLAFVSFIFCINVNLSDLFINLSAGVIKSFYCPSAFILN